MSKARFRGITAVSIDTKGRFGVPTRYREIVQNQFDNRVVVTIDTDAPCLLLYPLSEWETIEQKIMGLPSFNPQARRIQRLLMGHAQDLELDGNGRVLLPALLREYATLENRGMLVGQGKKFELWSEQNWEAGREVWLAEQSKSDNDLPQELQTLSL